jgi:hypothetical protein
MRKQHIEKLLEGRRFRPKMRTALSLVANGVPVREAAEVVGLATHQDVARAARELGIGRRRRNPEALAEGEERAA